MGNKEEKKMETQEKRKCPRHDRELEELWKDQLDCLECFEEYHQDMIESLSHQLVDQDYQEGRVD